MTKTLTCKSTVLILLLATLAAPLAQAQTKMTVHSHERQQFVPVAGANLSGSPATQYELNTVYGKTRSALEFLDRFWGGVFATSKRPFRRPGLKWMLSGQAFYKSEDHTIYLNAAFLVGRMRAAAEQTRTDGDMAFIIILAHEYGHSVQQQLGLLGGDCLRVELQADRMAGAFARAVKEANLLDPGDFDEATYTFFAGRDATDKYYACAHGSGTQRVEAFHTGLKGGATVALQR